MNNHPFYSTNRNIYDQSLFAARPTNLNGQNLLISQEQQRKLYDTLNTSIMGLQNYNSQSMNQPPGNFVQAQRQFIPGGVMFTFNSQPMAQTPGYMNPQNPQPVCFQIPNNNNNYFPQTLEQQIAVNEFQNRGLECLQYQQQMANNPFQLKFHLDKATSSSDLLNAPSQLPGSRSTPDLSNIGGVSQSQTSKCPPEYCKCSLMSVDTNYTPVDFCSNTRRLNLSKPPEKKSEQKSSGSNENPETKKKVCFADAQLNDKVDEGEQVSLKCPHCNEKSDFRCVIRNKKKGKSKKNLNKSRMKRDTESSSDSTESESECSASSSGSNKKHRNRSDSQYYSDSEYSC